MRHILPITVIAFLFGVLLPACSWFKDNATIVENVEPEFSLELIEKLDAPFKPIQIRVATLKKQNCKAVIHNTAFRNGRTILFNINDWTTDEPCTEQLTIRDTLIPIDVLTPGSYDLQVRIAKNLFSNGTLTVMPDRYLFECEKPLGFVIDRQEMLRVPDNLVWGYVSFTSSFYTDNATELIDELKSINQEANILSGNYGHFIMKNRNTVELPLTSSNLPVCRTFVFNKVASAEEIAAWVSKAHHRYLGNISLQVFNSAGKVWN